MAKVLKNERRRARAAASQMEQSGAAPENQSMPPPVVPLSEWRAMTLKEKFAVVAVLGDVDDEERARVNAAADISDTEMARLLMRLGKERTLGASARAAEFKKEIGS